MSLLTASQTLNDILADVTAYFSPFARSDEGRHPFASSPSMPASGPGAAGSGSGSGRGSGSGPNSAGHSPNPSVHHLHNAHHSHGVFANGASGAAASGDTRSPSMPASQSMAMPEHHRLLAEMAPHIMRPRILSAAVAAGNNVSANVSNSALIGFLPLTRTGLGGYSLAQPARSLVRLGNTIRQGPVTSNDIKALESSYQILANIAAGNPEEDIAEPKGVAKDVSLLRGFQATLPSRLDARNQRRKQRGRNSEHLGLTKMFSESQGLLGHGEGGVGDISIDDVDLSGPHAGPQGKEKRKARRTAASKSKDEAPLSLEELQAQTQEIAVEKEDINVRRMLVNSEIAEVEARIAALELVKQGLTRSLTSLREDELELNDEYDGVSEMVAVVKHRRSMPGGERESARNPGTGTTSRRRKGPLFLPSEHDELPPGVAFMTLTDHTAPITALDFSEPYGTLVSSALDDTVRVWDLATGAEAGRLRGHSDTVKCLQVEDELCITGSMDSTIKLWDLRRVEDYEARLSMKESGEMNESQISESDEGKDYHPCLRTLDGHSKAVTSLYFDDTCLVSHCKRRRKMLQRMESLRCGRFLLTFHSFFRCLARRTKRCDSGI